MFRKDIGDGTFGAAEGKSFKMRSWQIGLCLVGVFTLGFYMGLQKQSQTIAVVPENVQLIDEPTVPSSKVNSTPMHTNAQQKSSVSYESTKSEETTLNQSTSADYDSKTDKSSINEENSSVGYDQSEEDSLSTDDDVEEVDQNEVQKYDAEKEIESRRLKYMEHCEGRRMSLMGVTYRTGLVSRYGTSTGDVHFFTCFLPKAASSSMSAAMLLATGWIDRKYKNDITDVMWDDGRNKCSHNTPKCLKEFSQMPQRYRYMGANLDADDHFISLIVAREPMSRLVSAWKDKIYRRSDRDFYFDRYTKSMLRKMGKRDCPRTQTAAWDAGCRVPFADFVKWVADGNRAADEHWTPAAELCVACQANYTFIAHSEHFSEDIQVAAKMLNIDPNVLPDNYHASNLHAAVDNTDAGIARQKTTEEMFSEVPSRNLKQIREIYRSDYELFSYEMPQWLQNA